MEILICLDLQVFGLNEFVNLDLMILVTTRLSKSLKIQKLSSGGEKEFFERGYISKIFHLSSVLL